MGRLIKTINNDGEKDSITQNYYDKKGNLIRVYTGLSDEIQINGLDDITEGEDSDYSVTKYTYDMFGNVTVIEDSLNQTENMVYDKAKLLVSKTDRNNQQIFFEYDGIGNLKSKYTGDRQNEIVSLYDKNGKIKSICGNNQQIDYIYDNKGRLITETNGNETKEFTYDSDNNRKSFTLKKDGIVSMKLSYEYDKLNRLIKVYNGEINPDNLIATYTYDDNGRRTNTLYANGENIEYSYNLSGNLTSIENSSQTEFYTYYTRVSRQIRIRFIEEVFCSYCRKFLENMTIFPA